MSCSFQRVKPPMWRVLLENDPQCQKREEQQAGPGRVWPQGSGAGAPPPRRPTLPGHIACSFDQATAAAGSPAFRSSL